MENPRPSGPLHLVLWLERSSDAYMRNCIPQDLRGLLHLHDAHHERTGLSIMELAVLLTEKLMENIGSSEEGFTTLQDWLDSLGRAWQQHRQRLFTLMTAFLTSERPVVQTTYIIVAGDGRVRDAIPASQEAFEAMVASDAIVLTRT